MSRASIEFADNILQDIRNYADRNGVEFPRHFCEFLHKTLRDIWVNIEAMKEGTVQRIADLERKLQGGSE